jgi:Integrase zinc binding domain/Chromo (CHRromatin Organisation MOdifier) domain
MMLPEREPLLFWQDEVAGNLRLCIPRTMAKPILELAHDKENHYGIEKTYARLVAGYFLPQLLKLLKSYIAHCPKCAINRTLRHRPYGDAQPIESPSTPFHCITMDFIVGLPPSRRFAHGDELFDSVLTITDKFTKAIKLLVGKSTFTAENWATRYWQQVYPEWGLPVAIISDRDPKFLSGFWKKLFECAGTTLLTSTAYHPQTDGQSERTNQAVEIAFRYYVNLHQTDWAEHVDIIQAAMNTAVSATTKKSPFQLLYGFNPKHALDIIAGSVDADADWATLRELYRKEAHVAIVNAQAAMARYMDKRSTPLSLAVGDKVYLRLHHGYTLPSTVKAKIGQQRAGPFPIDAIIGKNAYRLRLPSTWKIWPVISVVFLEPATAGEDPFARTPAPAPAVVVEGDVDDSSYEVSAIVKKRYNRRRRTTEYLVRWKDYGAEHDQWFDEDELHHCRQLVFEYETAVGNAEWRPRDDPTWKPETESEQGEVNRDADMHGSSSMRRSSQLAV